MGHMVYSCQGMDASNSSMCFSVGCGIRMFCFDGAQTIRNLGKVDTISCMYCCSLSLRQHVYMGGGGGGDCLHTSYIG